MLHTVDNRKMLLLPILTLLLTQQGMTKPLDVTARITMLLSDNISTSLPEKAEAIDTILRLLAEIDLPAICEAVMMEKPDEVTQMDNIIAAAAKEQGFDSMMPIKLQTTDNMVLPADFPMKKGDILPADFPMKMKDMMKPVKERAATYVSPVLFSTPATALKKEDPTNKVIIKSVHSLKTNVSLSAEARRLESQELPKLDRPELIGFKLVPSEHYVKEMEGEKGKEVGVVGGTAQPIRSMAEGVTFQAPSSPLPVITEVENNSTFEPNSSTTVEVRNTPTTQSSAVPTSPITTTTTTTSTTTLPTTATPELETFSSYSFSTPSTSQFPEIETTTSNEIIEDISGTSMSNVAAAEPVVDVRNISVSENVTDEVSPDDKMMTTTTETTKLNTTLTNDIETSENTTSYREMNVTVSDELQSQNETVSLYDSVAFDDQTAETMVFADVDNSTQEALKMNATLPVTTEPMLNTTNLYNTNGSSSASTTTAKTATAAVTTTEEATTQSEATTTPTTEESTTEKITMTENDTVTAITEIDTMTTMTENDTVTAMTENDTMTTMTENATLTTTEEATTTATTVTMYNVTEAENDVSNNTVASSDELEAIKIPDSTVDLDATFPNAPRHDATTLDYFWTPGKTIRMSDSEYDYDDATDDSHTTSFHVSISSDDVPDVDATDDSNTALNDTDELTTEPTPEVSTESVTAAPGEYDYVYNLVDLTGDQKQETAYHRYDSTGSYGGYDVNNIDYAHEEASDYMMDPLKPGARFIAGNNFNKDHKDHGVNMQASADSPANTAAEQDFMLSAQPGYFNSLADQSSWGLHGDNLKHNSVLDDKEYDKQFIAHSEEPKETVTSDLASAMGVRQKTVWSEPTLPQIFFQPNGYACPGLFGYYADISDCQAFFICSWGMPYRFLCPPGTLWSSTHTVCDWSNNVDCGKKK